MGNENKVFVLTKASLLDSKEGKKVLNEIAEVFRPLTTSMNKKDDLKSYISKHFIFFHSSESKRKDLNEEELVYIAERIISKSK